MTHMCVRIFPTMPSYDKNVYLANTALLSYLRLIAIFTSNIPVPVLIFY